MPTITVLIFFMFLCDNSEVNGVIKGRFAIFDYFYFNRKLPLFGESIGSGDLFVSRIKVSHLFPCNSVLADEEFVSRLRRCLPLYPDRFPIMCFFVQFRRGSLEFKAIDLLGRL